MTLFYDLGQALYGERWRSELARSLRVDERTVRRWANGDYEPPEGVWGELETLAKERRKTLADLIARLKST